LSGRYEVVRFELSEPAMALATDAQGRRGCEFDTTAALGANPVEAFIPAFAAVHLPAASPTHTALGPFGPVPWPKGVHRLSLCSRCDSFVMREMITRIAIPA